MNQEMGQNFEFYNKSRDNQLSIAPIFFGTHFARNIDAKTDEELKETFEKVIFASKWSLNETIVAVGDYHDVTFEFCNGIVSKI